MQIAAVMIAATAALGASPAPQAGEGGEREALRRSLDTACQDLADKAPSSRSGAEDDQQWVRADDCRRAWFKAHEEAVWRLKLNPHARPTQAPSS